MNRKHIICNNCNKPNHESKECKEPITSWGIIVVNLEKIYENMGENYTLKHSHTNIKNKIFNITPQNHRDLENLSKFMNDIKFLLVQRKHSIGFMDFLRGKYKLDNIDQINSLFQHMNQNEIDKIAELDFDSLWKYMWNNDPNKTNTQKKEYIIAKQKFLDIKNGINSDVTLDFFIKNVTPLYSFNEWGFPKGRKDKNETTLECALREFSEETKIDLKTIKIIENINPIEENLIGTNGIPYRHIYYLAETVTSKLPDNSNNNEIGNLNYFNYTDASNLIREYHIEKKQILSNIYLYYLEILIEGKYN
jgi:ADP-ribose pyrophosphatase YjhB (NUDIX family)